MGSANSDKGAHFLEAGCHPLYNHLIASSQQSFQHCVIGATFLVLVTTNQYHETVEVTATINLYQSLELAGDLAVTSHRVP